jgi:hypothetical protein
LVKSTVSALRLLWQQRFGQVRPYIFAFLIGVSLSTGTVHAQAMNVTDVEATPIPGAGHDYIHMLDETVNPANGSLSIRIEVPVPKGRALT